MTGQPATIASLRDVGGIIVGTANYSEWLLQLTPDGFARVSSRPANSAVTVAVVGAEALNDGAPHHLALVRRLDLSSRQVELWVDGALAGFSDPLLMRDTGPYFPSGAGDPDPISVGGLRETGTTNVIQGFDGLVDDLKFYDRALTTEGDREHRGLRRADRAAHVESGRESPRRTCRHPEQP